MCLGFSIGMDHNVWKLHRDSGHTILWTYGMSQNCSFASGSFCVTHNPPWLPAARRTVSEIPSPWSSPSSVTSQTSFPQALRGLLGGTRNYCISEPQIFWDDPISHHNNFKIKARSEIFKRKIIIMEVTSQPWLKQWKTFRLVSTQVLVHV